MTEASSSPLPPIYEESSQYRHWRFSPSQIWDTRKSNHEAAVERVRRNFQEDQRESQEATTNDLKYLSVDDELVLCRFFESQLQGICSHFKFPDVVMATAVIYMKRFYLHNTVMDYHPKDVLLTCLFLATKSEGERISIEQFVLDLQLPDSDVVLGLEFIVSQGLKFEYLIHHPYRPAYGFFLDMQTISGMDIQPLKETYTKVQRIIKSMLLTDVCLIYQPSQLALAAFVIAGKETSFDAKVISYIETRFGSEQKDQLLQMFDKIADILEHVTVSKDEARVIDRQLRMCMNPANNPDSAL
ncbi:cyclin-like protein [Zychaea mexicana]|uniref:cyclin-like protein n=1 Tax=Zychaea mexicana TaxID=64656 RepID=UPI0022FE7328|nr:cyclin-like protein [Zychaea mexicana]KAI9498699.1 cyclin-like protein [Zychaea mexicana]